MRLLIVLVFYSVCASAVYASARAEAKAKAKGMGTCRHDARNFRCVKYVSNYDGDTITFQIDGVHPLLGNRINIRLAGVDTPEVKTKDVCEKNAGLGVKEIVNSILKNAKRIDLENVERGKYFRIVADVKADGLSLSTYLLKKGLGYPYHGGKKRKINWCKS